MRYGLGFSSKLESSSVYIECSVRNPGVNHPICEIVERFPLVLEKIQQKVDEMKGICFVRLGKTQL